MRERPFRNLRRALVGSCVVAALFVVGAIAWLFLRPVPALAPTPGCVVSAEAGPSQNFTLRFEQAKNASTIAAVAARMGMPNHAVTVALAAALQESKLLNLDGGDRDSGGLFQERPSQGWGTYEQVRDPVYASTAFFQHLIDQPEWTELSVADAAQLVERSADATAYAQWEPNARSIARAVTGEAPSAIACRGVALAAPYSDVAATATAELGDADITGTHPAAQGWLRSIWLVTHAADFGIDTVMYGGSTWTASTGQWSTDAVQPGDPEQLTFLRIQDR